MWRLVCPMEGSGSRSANCPCTGSASDRCSLPVACISTKTCADNFFLNHLFNAKCTPVKRQPHPFFAAIESLCIKGWTIIKLLQSIMFCIYVIRDTKSTFGNAAAAAFPKNLIFFLLKFNMVCMFWIILMCWCQKWFLKNKKKSFTCILARKVIWKTPATTLPNTL